MIHFHDQTFITLPQRSPIVCPTSTASNALVALARWPEAPSQRRNSSPKTSSCLSN
ncbi:unnamed protein product, partial [Clonostachys rosea]